MTISYRLSRLGFVAVTLPLGYFAAVHTATADGRTGSAMEAKAMLQRAVEAIDANPTAALKSFTAGTNGFKDRDLYVFCAGPDGIMTAHGANPDFIGETFCDFVDRAGKRAGQEMCSNANRTFKTVDYMWPRPGESTPSHKVTYYTMAGDQICGVGFYK